jgi:glycosidase
MQDWQRSVIYQIYPKSFHSHAGNATGDLLGSWTSSTTCTGWGSIACG